MGSQFFRGTKKEGAGHPLKEDIMNMRMALLGAALLLQSCAPVVGVIEGYKALNDATDHRAGQVVGTVIGKVGEVVSNLSDTERRKASK